MIKITTQLAVFLDNRPGLLARTCQALKDAGVNILALSILDTVDHVVVRMVVDRVSEAEQALSNLHAAVHARDVVYIDLENSPGALARICERLTEAGINIEYAYCTSSEESQKGALILRTNDLEATITELS